MDGGYLILFDYGFCSIQDKKIGKKIVDISMAQNKMFPLEVSDVKSYALVVRNNDAKIWHLRYGHLHMKGLKLLAQKNMVVGLPKIDDLDFCEGCIYGKESKNSFPVNKSLRAFACLEIMHTDIFGPMSVESLRGSRYFLLFIDDYSHMSWVFFLKHKSETFENFKKFKALVEKQSGCSIKTLRLDRGGEFNSNEFNIFCEENDIRRELTAPYSLEQNGVVEGKNELWWRWLEA